MQPRVGEKEERDIQKRVFRILRDLGHPDPPVNLSDVRDLLSLDLTYYSSTDPELVLELSHRFRLLVRKTLPDLGNHLRNALEKSGLCAFWVPAANRIMIDREVPTAKHRWIEAHEITHSITPWHREFLLGDNAHTLDPACHAVLELEANHGAGRLLFLNDLFSKEAMQTDLSFKSIKTLARRYQNSIISTFWRTVEDRDPSQPVFGLISHHPRYPEIGTHDGTNPWRHYIGSLAFRSQFAGISASQIFDLVKQHASYRRTGPILEAKEILRDVLEDEWEFHIESFSTKYDLLTLGYPINRRKVVM